MLQVDPFTNGRWRLYGDFHTPSPCERDGSDAVNEYLTSPNVGFRKGSVGNLSLAQILRGAGTVYVDVGSRVFRANPV